jgi:hypothetical protein
MQPGRPDEVTGDADDREASMTARSWQALSVTAAAAGIFILALTRRGTVLTLGAAGVLALLAAAVAARRAFALSAGRPSGRRRRLPVHDAFGASLAITALTAAAAVLTAIALLT